MSDGERKKYEDLRDKDKERYEQQMKEFNSTGQFKHIDIFKNDIDKI